MTVSVKVVLLLVGDKKKKGTVTPRLSKEASNHRPASSVESARRRPNQNVFVAATTARSIGAPVRRQTGQLGKFRVGVAEPLRRFLRVEFSFDCRPCFFLSFFFPMKTLFIFEANYEAVVSCIIESLLVRIRFLTSNGWKICKSSDSVAPTDVLFRTQRLGDYAPQLRSLFELVNHEKIDVYAAEKSELNLSSFTPDFNSR